MNLLIIFIIYLIFAPVIGGIVTGVDRKITARMQRRYGPPIMQPFYDVYKLFQKENMVVRRSQNVYIFFYLLFIVFTGALFFTGEDFLLVIFSLTLAAIFFILAGYKGSSPYSYIGAERELLQLMSYEPMVILTAVGMYMVTKTFYIANIIAFPEPLIIYLPGIFVGFAYVLTIKLRKSPFDLSTSHHGHQEIVKGITTEFSGSALGLIEIAHWYEVAFLIGFIYLFYAVTPVIGILLVLAVYFLEIFIDNVFARLRWQYTLSSSWIIAIILGLGNIIALTIFR
ncbi:MAG: NADH-quinone oxidoreductase subunit H [Candidatus Margulisbacteria bacterium]|nr:NADH-quinone oxidoreductase subunit H [Candidatus Margulisiibacteriota bacterium]